MATDDFPASGGGGSGSSDGVTPARTRFLSLRSFVMVLVGGAIGVAVGLSAGYATGSALAGAGAGALAGLTAMDALDGLVERSR